MKLKSTYRWIMGRGGTSIQVAVAETSLESVGRRRTPDKPLRRVEFKATSEYFNSILESDMISLGDIVLLQELRESDDPKLRELGIAYFNRCLKAYEKHVGHIFRNYFGDYQPIAVVMSGDHLINYSYPTELIAFAPPDFELKLSLCDSYKREAGDILKGQSRRLVLSRIYHMIIATLAPFDSIGLEADSSHVEQRIKIALQYLDEELIRLRTELDQVAERIDRRVAQQVYLFGMLPGILILGLLVTLSTGLRLSGLEINSLRIALIGGALGAILSVLARTTRAQLSQSLDVDREAGNALVFCAGAFRPIIGAILGLAVYVLLNAGLLPIEMPGDSQRAYFFAATAFLAGFSERLAQDALVRTSSSILSSDRSQNDQEATRR